VCRYFIAYAGRSEEGSGSAQFFKVGRKHKTMRVKLRKKVVRQETYVPAVSYSRDKYIHVPYMKIVG
jgi:hypothetical protein